LLTGAAIFVAVEGTQEVKQLDDLRKERYTLLRELRRLTRDPKLAENDREWEGRAVPEMQKFEDFLYESFKHGNPPKKDNVWGFWNAVFYCGTIYTTIGELQLQNAGVRLYVGKCGLYTAANRVANPNILRPCKEVP
jgi:hypothetical protein